MKINFWQIFLLLLSSEGVAQSLTPFIESPAYPFTISNFVSNAIDFDNDGDDDVYGYIAGLDNTGSLFRNDGNMTFTEVSASANFPTHNDGSTLDIDKNGFMDISFWIEDTLVCYPNYGAEFGFPECTNLILTDVFPVLLESIENVRFSDYNGDGIYDLFLLESLAQNSRIWVKQGQLNCSLGQGYSLTSDPPVILLVLPNTHDPVFSFADLNNDGSFDLLFGTGNGNQLGSIFYNYNYRVYLNDGSGNFQEYLNSGFDTGRSLAFGALGEFNNDGIVDIFSGSADCCVGGTGGTGNINPLYVFNSNSILDYTSSTTSMLRASDRRYYNMGTVADINLDRYQDVLWTNMGAYAFSSSSLQCFINDGAGTFTEQSGVLDINVGTSETPALHASQLSAMIDINIDNKPDLHIMSFQPYELTPFSNNTKINGSNLNSVKLKLDACVGLKEGWGARLQYKCNESWSYLQHTAYSNSNYPFLYLGMGDATVIDTLAIFWIGGASTMLTNIAAGAFISISENPSCISPVVGCTDSLAANFNPDSNVNQGCLYDASAFVYHDLNGNNIFDEGEPALNEIPVLVGNTFTNTNVTGYATVIANSDAALSLPGLSDNWQVYSQSAQQFDIASGVDTIFIGLSLIPGNAEVTTLLYGSLDDVLQCVEGYIGGLGIHNTGSQTVSGFMTLTCDSLFTPEVFSDFAIPPLVLDQGQAVWEIADFQPGEFELLNYYIPGPGTEYIGNTYPFQLNLLLYDNEGNTVVNQSWTTNATVSCAYDPNDLTPTPIGYSENHFIQAGDRVLFRVRFQNLGNAPATDVRVEQYIDSTVWDVYSFEPAYPIAAEVDCLHDNGDIDITNGLLVYNLENINLPDSVSDPLGSQRQFHYWLRAREDLPPGTELFNQASIIFDSNPPIITNQTYHTIFDCNSFTGPVGDDEICVGDTASLQATQPFVDTYTWSFDAFTSSNDTLELTNLSEGLHTISLYTTNELCGMSGETHSFVVNVRPIPNNEIDNVGGLLTAQDGNQWQWYYQDNAIGGATENSYTVQDTGAYHVLITNEFGCSVESETFVYITDVSSVQSWSTLRLYPNPMTTAARLELPQGTFDIAVYNLTGACVRKLSNRQGTVFIERASLAAGVYQLQVSQGDVVKSVRVVVE